MPFKFDLFLHTIALATLVLSTTAWAQSDRSLSCTGDDFLTERMGFAKSSNVKGGFACAGKAENVTISNFSELKALAQRNEDCLHVHLEKDIVWETENNEPDKRCEKIELSQRKITFDGRIANTPKRVIDFSVCQDKSQQSTPLIFTGRNIIVVGITFKNFQKSGQKDASKCNEGEEGKPCKDVSALTFLAHERDDFEQKFWVHRCRFVIDGNKFTGGTETLKFGGCKFKKPSGTDEDEHFCVKGREIRATFSALEFVNTNHNFDIKTQKLNKGVDQSASTLKYTLAYSKFEQTGERSPKVGDGAVVHFFNNYYANVLHAIKYSVEDSDTKASMLGEYNVFESLKDDDATICKQNDKSKLSNMKDGPYWNQNEINIGGTSSRQFCEQKKSDYERKAERKDLEKFAQYFDEKKYEVTYYGPDACKNHDKSANWDCDKAPDNGKSLRSTIQSLIADERCELNFFS